MTYYYGCSDMEIEIAVSKTNKYASHESGDTVEVVERPNGGLSVVMADGQSSGKGAKYISTLVVRKVIALLAEGVRDGAAARAASDYLFTEKGGKVSATLNILSIDMLTNTLVITRNSPTEALLILQDEIRKLDEPSTPIGLHRNIRPVIVELPLQVGLMAIAYTDGLAYAGTRYGQTIDTITEVRAILESEEEPSSILMAESLLEHALKLENQRPIDDISIVALRVNSHVGDNIRRMSVRLPLT